VKRKSGTGNRKVSSRRKKSSLSNPSIAIVGAGNLATFLAISLHRAGFNIAEIISRETPRSLRNARSLAAKIGAHGVTDKSAKLDAELVWLCVPDREIRNAALAVSERLRVLKHQSSREISEARLEKKDSEREKSRLNFAFHSSGALSSRELDPLRRAGLATASVHPLMTFVPHTNPSLTEVPFALEGDAKATGIAKQIVRKLGAKTVFVSASNKSAYHAWATLASPLFLAFLVTLEEAALAAGIKRRDARAMSLPIIRQTLENYSRLGSAHSFSGPIIRGDVQTVAKHLALLKAHSKTREVYRALAIMAIDKLPSRNKREFRRLLKVDGRSLSK
jgi:predicted short-subunit dehydrogenase-like oxidoreductase (DUF2520 family)